MVRNFAWELPSSITVVGGLFQIFPVAGQAANFTQLWKNACRVGLAILTDVVLSRQIQTTFAMWASGNDRRRHGLVVDH